VVVESQSLKRPHQGRGYNERAAEAAGLVVEQAHRLVPEYLLKD